MENVSFLFPSMFRNFQPKTNYCFACFPNMKMQKDRKQVVLNYFRSPCCRMVNSRSIHLQNHLLVLILIMLSNLFKPFFYLYIPINKSHWLSHRPSIVQARTNKIMRDWEATTLFCYRRLICLDAAGLKLAIPVMSLPVTKLLMS